jgi:hypothetical protein
VYPPIIFFRFLQNKKSRLETDLEIMTYDHMDWIHLAEDRDKWWTLINMAINLWVPQKKGN